MKVNQSRDIEIFRAVISGEPLRSVGARFGITGNRARQITMEVRRACCKFDGEIPKHDLWSCIDLRKFEVFWNLRADQLAVKWGVA